MLTKMKGGHNTMTVSMLVGLLIIGWLILKICGGLIGCASKLVDILIVIIVVVVLMQFIHV